MNQLAFDIPGRRLPRARRNDGDGSHAAADALERSGRAAQQLSDVLDAVRRWPNRTSKELSALSGLDYHMVARRLSELDGRGLIKRDRPKGERFRWRPA